MFEFGKATLDEVSKCVDISVDDRLYLSVTLGRDHGDNIIDAKVIQDRIRVVPLVTQHYLGVGSRFGHQRGIALYVRDLSSAQNNSDG